MFYAHLLHGFQCKFLNMETVYDPLCPRKSITAYVVHAVGQVQCYSLDFIAQAAVNLP